MRPTARSLIIIVLLPLAFAALGYLVDHNTPKHIHTPPPPTAGLQPDPTPPAPRASTPSSPSSLSPNPQPPAPPLSPEELMAIDNAFASQYLLDDGENPRRHTDITGWIDDGTILSITPDYAAGHIHVDLGPAWCYFTFDAQQAYLQEILHYYMSQAQQKLVIQLAQRGIHRGTLSVTGDLHYTGHPCEDAPQLEPTAPDPETRVYITAHGDTYHLSGCPHLLADDTPTPLTAHKARLRNYDPCEECKPPHPRIPTLPHMATVGR